MSGYFSADVALTGRHARFSAAVGELSYESGLSVEARLGAVGELVRLADEWLADVSVSEGACHREAQDIVSALCAYVSTPFPLASRAELYGEVPPNLDQQETLQFHRDKKALTEESRVRVRILEEIHTRVRWKPAGGATKKKESQQVAAGEITPGPWSGFYFEFFDSASFSSAEFFFPVDFSGSYWGGAVLPRRVLCTVRHIQQLVLRRERLIHRHPLPGHRGLQRLHLRRQRRLRGHPVHVSRHVQRVHLPGRGEL